MLITAFPVRHPLDFRADFYTRNDSNTAYRVGKKPRWTTSASSRHHHCYLLCTRRARVDYRNPNDVERISCISTFTDGLWRKYSRQCKSRFVVIFLFFFEFLFIIAEDKTAGAELMSPAKLNPIGEASNVFGSLIEISRWYQTRTLHYPNTEFVPVQRLERQPRSRPRKSEEKVVKTKRFVRENRTRRNNVNLLFIIIFNLQDSSRVVELDNAKMLTYLSRSVRRL